MTASARRPLDLGERYFRLLGRCSSMSLVCGAELPRRVSRDDVAAAWRRVGATSALPGLRIDDEAGDLLWAPPDAEIGLSETDQVAAVRQQLQTEFADGEPLARLGVVEHDAGTTLLLCAHHAVADARALLGVLRAVVDALDAGSRPGEGESAGDGGSPELPAPLLERTRPGLRWPTDRRGMLPLLRDRAERRRGEGEAASYPDHPRPAASHPGLDCRTARLDLEQTAALRERARAAGSTVTGLVAAAALLSSRATLRPHGDRLALTVPVDLRPRLEPAAPLDAPGVAVSLLGTSHDVPAPSVGVQGLEGLEGLAGLATEVSTRVATAVADGEGELFYALTAPDRVPLDARGEQRIGDALAAADDAIAVSNVGVLPADGRAGTARYWFALPPTPNQVCFLALSTSGAGLTVVSTSARLPPDDHRAWLDGLLARCGVHS